MRTIILTTLALISLASLRAAITEAEYFFNSDPGQGNGNAIAISGDGTSLDVEVDPALIQALPIGFHLLAVRVRNDSGEWSDNEIRSFLKKDPNDPVEEFPSNSTITAAEYFINSDPGQGNGTLISVTGDGTNLDVAVSPVSIAALENGSHVLAVRVKNALGHWSNPEFRHFAKTPVGIAEPTSDPQIASLEYQWFQNQAAVTAPVLIPANPAARTYSFSELASLAGLSEGGTYQILFTPIDSEGNRGLWETRTVTIETTDSDGDGVPDQWELAYGFNPNNAADLLAGNDLDEDGVTDRDEFLAGANPTLKDTDGDGISDKVEISLASLGLDVKVAQPGLTNLVNGNLTEGLNLGDIRRLKPGAPLIMRDPASGNFLLTMEWQKSPDLSTPFAPAQLAPGSVSLTAEGKVQVEIAPDPDDPTGFLRVEVQE